MGVQQPVTFDVLSLGRSDRKDFAKVIIQFKSTPDKSYTYDRKVGRASYNRLFVVIDGCRVLFTKDYELVSVTREYDTKGVKRQSTKGLSKKIKQEAQQKGLIQDVENDVEWESDVVDEEVDIAPELDKPIVPDTPPSVEVPKGKVRHEKYEMIKTCLSCDIPVYLAGPAGSGKNHTVEQIAKEMGWNFYFTNSVQQEYKLTGFVDAGGEYHETEFFKACMDDTECVFFLDEMDASIPDVLVLLNAAIANGYFEFPCGRVDFENVHFVAAGNTVGSGADDTYTGRMVLDQATLDRFAIIEFDYDKNVELKLAKGNVQLLEFIRDLRQTAKTKGIRATFSYRCIMMVVKLEAVGMNTKDILKIAVLKGLDQDTINTFRLYGSSKYYQALRDIQT